LDEGQLDHGQEVDSQFLEAGADSPALLDPADAAFDDASAAICVSVEAQRSPAVVALLVAALGDDRADGVAAQPVADAVKAVSLVCGHTAGATAGSAQGPWNAHRVHQEFELGRFVRLPRRDFDGKRQASAVSNQVQLGAESAARAAQSVVSWLLEPPF
jgi:hypothetical protein